MGESKEMRNIQRSLRLNMTHINLWERQHGRIPRGAFVILRTGWSHFYNYRDKFFGYFTDEPKQVFPGMDFFQKIKIQKAEALHSGDFIAWNIKMSQFFCGRKLIQIR